MNESSSQDSSPRAPYLFRGLLRGWSQPGDVVSLLMIINGDIVQKALAQLAGPRLVPVSFSFGWVVYSIQAFSTIIGTGRLMPAAPDQESIVVNIDSGHQRANRSWILGRLFRDWHYNPISAQGIYITVLDAIDKKDAMRARPGSSGAVSEYGNGPEAGDPSGTPRCLQANLDGPSVKLTAVSNTNSAQPITAMVPAPALLYFHPSHMMIRHLQTWTTTQWQEKGWIWVLAWAIIGLQFVVAFIPLTVDDDATTLAITSLGTGLALGCGLLPRWKEEKWSCRKNSTKRMCLLKGNGDQHVMVVLGNGVGLGLEDLAGGRLVKKARTTAALTFLLTMLWVLLLIALARDEGRTWFVMIIGALGVLQNIVVAGTPRPASAFGFHLRKREVFYSSSVRGALCQAEEKIAGLGYCLRPIFFPGKSTRKDDEAFASAEERRAQQHRQTHPSEPEEAASTGRTAEKQVISVWRLVGGLVALKVQRFS